MLIGKRAAAIAAAGRRGGARLRQAAWDSSGFGASLGELGLVLLLKEMDLRSSSFDVNLGFFTDRPPNSGCEVEMPTLNPSVVFGTARRDTVFGENKKNGRSFQLLPTGSTAL